MKHNVAKIRWDKHIKIKTKNGLQSIYFHDYKKDILPGLQCMYMLAWEWKHGTDLFNFYHSLSGRVSNHVLMAGMEDTLFFTACKFGYPSIISDFVMAFK